MTAATRKSVLGLGLGKKVTGMEVCPDYNLSNVLVQLHCGLGFKVWQICSGPQLI